MNYFWQAIMKQKCNLLDKELKKEQLLETVARLDDDINKIINRIHDMENGSEEQGGEQ